MHGKRRKSFLRLGLLALCFLLGAACALVLASGMPETAGTELRQYLAERAGTSRCTGAAALATAALYLRVPVLAALLGAVSGGGVLLCTLAAAFGFVLAFSVGCFTAAFGEGGVLLAASVMGLRCLVTLPCFFLLAVSPAGGQAGRAAVRRLGICTAVLLLGAGVDMALTPFLLRWALAFVTGGRG